MTGPATPPALALCGSNLGGDQPFSCALRLPGGIFAAHSPAGGRGDLATLAAELCAQHGVTPADLRELRLDLGPGSYTGLRVVVTFVRFLQRFGDLPVLACDSLEGMAATASAGPGPARLRPLLDARRGRYHCGTLRHDVDGVRHLEPPAAQPLEQVLASLQPGDQVVTTAALVAQLGPALAARGAIARPMARFDAAALFTAPVLLQATAAEQLEPRYLMGSYAED